MIVKKLKYMINIYIFTRWQWEKMTKKYEEHDIDLHSKGNGSGQ